ncbi:MAG TPA: 3-deoxy-D-manno-octulosonic acid transferase [Rhodospirillales bacterium]|jgi:3-deoxy-D-manno-octulosonic-acid transferase|nr:3-deoxy-D-manno-octulosonic acid transferase [Rhodospirillales bacterium]
MLTLYRAAGALSEPFVRAVLGARLRRGKEDPARVAERLGHAGRSRPAGPLAWVHASSVGESLSMIPLIESLISNRPELGVLVTTGTVTSAALMCERLPGGAFHQYAPVDRLSFVRRFLDHWRPDLALWAESEFWPNLIAEAHARAIPLVLVNGRISERSFSRWRLARPLIAELLSGFALCLGQSEADAERLRVLGAGSARCLGNLKFAAPPLPADAAELERLHGALGGRPRWLVASSHAGEEALAGRVHQRLGAKFPALLTIVVPRHPDRGPTVAKTLRGLGLEVRVRSQGESPGPGTDVYLADTLGELGLFYRLASVVLVGKSLVPLGGQNPLEPARIGCAVLFGPHMANFSDIAERMKAEGAAEEVADEDALRVALARLLDDDPTRQGRSEAARRFAESQAHVLDAVASAIEPFLDASAKARGVHART